MATFRDSRCLHDSRLTIHKHLCCKGALLFADDLHRCPPLIIDAKLHRRRDMASAAELQWLTDKRQKTGDSHSEVCIMLACKLGKAVEVHTRARRQAHHHKNSCKDCWNLGSQAINWLPWLDFCMRQRTSTPFQKLVRERPLPRRVLTGRL